MERGDRTIAAVLIVTNITELRAAEEARRRAEHEAENLRRLLPICAWCKRIRDDQGYWEAVEEFLTQETGTLLTHSMCPECEGHFDDELGPDDDGDDGPDP